MWIRGKQQIKDILTLIKIFSVSPIMFFQQSLGNSAYLKHLLDRRMTAWKMGFRKVFETGKM